MKKSFFTLTAIVIFNNLFAQKIDTTNTVTELNSITIKALRASDNAPFTKSEISKEQIQLMNTGVDLPILLNNITNVVTTSDAGTGVGYTGIRLRGSDMSRLNVTINGVPVNDAESQASYFVDFADIASSAQSIQIQRGVGSSTNGAGAFGGSINLNTIDLPIQKFVQYNVDYCSFNTLKNTIKIGSGLIKNKFCVTARVSKITSNGYIQRSASNLFSTQFTAAYYADKKTSLVFNWMLGKEKTGQAWNGVPQDSLQTNRTYNELGLKSDGTFYNNQTDNYMQNYFQLFINHQINKNWKCNVTPYLTRGLGYYQEYKNNETLSNYLLPNYKIDTTIFTTSDLIRQLWLNNYLYGINANVIGTIEKNIFTFGVAANNYYGTHYGIVTNVIAYPMNEKKWYDVSANKLDMSSFAKAEFNTNDFLKYYLDIQFRHVAYNINGFQNNPELIQNLKYNFFNPKFGLQYLISNSNLISQKIYASFSIAHKEPNRDDLEANINTTPSAESLQNFEIGYSAKNKNNYLQTNFYYMHYNNQLVLTGKINDVGAYIRSNTPDSYRAGVEVEMKNSFLNNHIILNSNIAFSINKIKNFTEYNTNYDSNFNFINQVITQHYNTDISFSPNIVAGVGISVFPLQLHSLRIDVNNKFVSKQYLDNTSNENKIIKAFYTTDVITNYFFKLKNIQCSARFGVVNIFNKLYASNGYTYSYLVNAQPNTFNYYYPQAGTRYSLGLGINL